jgi:hypothetical protein
MLFGIALIVTGAVVLFAMRRSLWPGRFGEEEPEPTGSLREHQDPPAEAETEPEYGARPIYVPAEGGTVYVSGGRDG